MLTAEGAQRIWEILAGQSDDTLDGGAILVEGGGQEARSAIEELSIAHGVLTATATFGEDFANFEWRHRELLTKQGVVLDAANEDMGRKASGHEWTITVEVELAAQGV
jgi:hypothetical protein